MLRLSALLLVGAFAGGRYVATHATVITPHLASVMEDVHVTPAPETAAGELPGEGAPQRALRNVRDLVTAVRGLPAVVCALTAEAAAGWGGRSWMNAPSPPLGAETAERVANFPRGRLTLGDVALLIDSLSTPDACVREVAVRLLGRMEAPVVEERLIERLTAGTPVATRQAAALTLGLVESKGAIDPLVRLVGDDETGVRANAVWALGRIGEKRVVPSLRRTLADEEELVRGAAAGALGALEDADSVDELLRVLRTDRSPRVRRTAAWALGTMELRAAGSGLVAALRAEQEPEVREMIVWALGSIEDPSAVAALTEVMRRDASEDVREGAAWALGTIEDADAASALGEAVAGDARAEVRATAAWALGQLELSAAPAGLIKGATDADPDVRTSAAWALSEIGDARALDALRTAMKRETHSKARRAQLRAILKGGERSEQFFKELLTSEDAEVREAAVRGMAGRGMNPWPWPMPRPRPFP